MVDTPPRSDPSLYRILPFHRVVQLFERSELYFAHPSSWQDPYETKLRQREAARVFAQCWCKKGVSDAMWRIYSPDTLGVRIRTTRPLLTSALRTAASAIGIRIYIKQVKYLPQSEVSYQVEAIADDLAQRYDSKLACQPLFLKRKAFHHESEVRAVAYVPTTCGADLHDGLKVPIKPHLLIQSILVDPRAPKEFVRAYKHFLNEKLGFVGRVAQSELYADTEPLEVV